MGLFDFFKKDWQHSNPEKRRAGIADLKDPQDILDFLLNETDESLKNECLKKLDSVVAIHNVQQLTHDKALLEILEEQLSHIYLKECLLEKSDHAEEFFEQMTCTEDFKKIYQNSKNFALRKKAIAKLAQDKVIAFLSKEENPDLARIFLDRLETKEELEAASEKAKMKATRKQASKRLAKLFPEVQAEEVKIAETPIVDPSLKKAEKVIQALKNLEQFNKWDQFSDQFDTENAKWDALSITDATLLKNYEEALTACRTSIDAYAAEQAAAAAKISARENADTILAEIQDKISESAETLQADDYLKPQEEAWLTTIEKIEEGKETLQKSFDKSLQYFAKQQEKLQQRQAKAQEFLANIEENLSKVEALTSDEEFIKAFKIIRWPKNPGDDVQAFSGRYEALKARFDQLKEAQQKELDTKLQILRQSYANFMDQIADLSAESTTREKTEQVKTLQKEWKALTDLPEKEMTPLNKQFRKACDAYFDKLGENIEEQRWAQLNNLGLKEQLILEVKALASITDDKQLVAELKEKFKQWKAIGPVDHNRTESLWQEFKTAYDEQNARCQAYFDKLDADRQQALEVKVAICEKAEACQENTDWKKTTDALKALQADWKTTGHAPKGQDQALWNRFRTACDVFFSRKKEHFAALDIEKGANLVAKQQLLERMEIACAKESNKETADAVKALQAEWKNIGPASRKEEQVIWTAFRAAADVFFGKRHEQFAEKREQQAELSQEKQALMTKLEAYLVDFKDDWSALGYFFKQAQKDWRQLGQASREDEKKLNKQFQTLCDQFFSQRNEMLSALSKEEKTALAEKEEQELSEQIAQAEAQASSVTEEEAGENLVAKQKILKAAAEIAGTDYEVFVEEELKTDNLAAQLQMAMSASPSTESTKKVAYGQICQEVRELQAAWIKIGPVAEEHQEKLFKNFKNSLDKFYSKRQKQGA